MKVAFWLLMVTVQLHPAPELVLQADRLEHLLILNRVYLNGQGPFRMMIDTGNSSSVLSRAAASSLGIHPAFAVQVATAAGVATVAAALLNEVRIGAVRDAGIEVMIMDPAIPGIDGALGQSWLIRHDYLLDYRGRRLVLDTTAPPEGIRTPLRSVDGRPQVSAQVNGRPQDLFVDSGTPVLILFGETSSTGPVRLVTNLGSLHVRADTARVTIAGSHSRRLPAAKIDGPPQPALLPTAVFKSVYISNRAGVAVFGQ
jgi:hypothetical protein